MALAGQEKRQISQTAKRKTAVAAGEAAPAIVQYVVVFLGAYFECDERVIGRSRRRLTSRYEIGTRAPDGVFDEIRYEEREDEADEPAQERDVRFVGAGLEDEGPCYEDRKRDGAGVYEEPN